MLQLLKAQLGKSVALAENVPILTGCIPGRLFIRVLNNAVMCYSHLPFLIDRLSAGAVPPFGSLFPCKPLTLMDPSLVEQGEFINFNAVCVF